MWGSAGGSMYVCGKGVLRGKYICVGRRSGEGELTV